MQKLSETTYSLEIKHNGKDLIVLSNKKFILDEKYKKSKKITPWASVLNSEIKENSDDDSVIFEFDEDGNKLSEIDMAIIKKLKELEKIKSKEIYTETFNKSDIKEEDNLTFEEEIIEDAKDWTQSIYEEHYLNNVIDIHKMLGDFYNNGVILYNCNNTYEPLEKLMLETSEISEILDNEYYNYIHNQSNYIDYDNDDDT